MENNIDFNYEYSDLNLFKTRVQILTGEYADTILEFGGSLLAQDENKNTFTFSNFKHGLLYILIRSEIKWCIT